jgi:succinate-semialdehyde dehydrogenase / glutarate-semialdehyde dehydrogenase
MDALPGWMEEAAMELQDPSLVRSQALVDGDWVDAEDGTTFAVHDPATGTQLATVPRMGRVETRRAIAAAERALPAWRGATAKERARILRRWSDLMHEHVEDLARLLTSEQGKPLAESRAEVAYGASFLEWFGEEGKRVYGDTIPSHAPDVRILVTKEPVGVTGGITPWNFPIAMPARKAAPALAAGCPMVLKPAEQTPLSALAFAELGLRAGLPPGVFNVVTGDADDAPEIGAELTDNPVVRKLGFTGSTAVGKLLMERCAPQVKQISLELGGNAPFIVFDDADIASAVVGAITCKFRNSGQTCISANRILVHDDVHDRFVDELLSSLEALPVGNGLDDGTRIGPLIDTDALDKVERHVADAQDRGATLLRGGSRHALGQTFYEPTVLTGVSEDADMCCEETFGPVAGIRRFADEDEAVAIANDTRYGLAAYFYARDVGRTWRVAEKLEYGIVGINTGFISTEVAPFGGFKESGIGREGSRYGIDEWLEIKYHCLGDI